MFWNTGRDKLTDYATEVRGHQQSLQAVHLSSAELLIDQAEETDEIDHRQVQMLLCAAIGDYRLWIEGVRINWRWCAGGLLKLVNHHPPSGAAGANAAITLSGTLVIIPSTPT